MKRIQRKRTKGWKMPENTKFVGRPTKFGNPLKLAGGVIFIDASHRRNILDRWVFYNYGNIKDLISLYKQLWSGVIFQNKDLQYWSDRFKKLDLNELKGKNLACFCSLDSPCHADVILERLKNLSQ